MGWGELGVGLGGMWGGLRVLGGTERGPQQWGKAAGFGEESRFPPILAGMGAGSLWPLKGRVWSRVAAKEPCYSIGKGRLSVPFTGTGCAVCKTWKSPGVHGGDMNVLTALSAPCSGKEEQDRAPGQQLHGAVDPSQQLYEATVAPSSPCPPRGTAHRDNAQV